MPSLTKTDPLNLSGERIRLKTNLLIFMMIIFGPLGDVLLGKGMKQVGAIASWAPADISHFLFRAFTSVTIWLAVASFVVFFVAYMLVLSWADYSYVQPASALSYGLVTLLAHFVLHEKITSMRWAGVLLICLGVFVVGHTQPRTTEQSSC
jgi:drug/metabolite transporter (DMT)-like permease